ncbi:Cytochrome c oxidase subunit 6B [Trametes pubescens]|uniref:Cytochrome c oxidase subunit 6B n=1 Tax=Trametes pubescens TaxID=154538 RepID=A0A1M2VPN8_TRAPU|nr:Cytochrome c oxidase subunit 6B [Trametes pubescens]
MSESDLSSKYVLQTAGFDARFPNTNQTRHWSVSSPLLSSSPSTRSDVAPRNHPFLLHLNSFQNYTDYFKCIAAKGEDYAPCKQFKRAYNSLCPNEWVRGRHPFSTLTSYANLLPWQINKWDEQRENGTFPASLEP